MIDIASDEKIILKVRKHWFPLVSEIIVMVILVLVLPVFYAFILRLNFIDIPGDPAYLLLAIESMWILFVWFMFCRLWASHYLDVWVITNKRLIDIEQKGFFNREVSTIRLDKIQDVTISVNGFIRSILKFGKVTIQSAGEIEHVFTMNNMANPYYVKEMLVKLSDQAVEKFEPKV